MGLQMKLGSWDYRTAEDRWIGTLLFALLLGLVETKGPLQQASCW